MQRLVSYSDFVADMHAVHFDGPHDSRLWNLLDEISEAEFETGGGMLSALVVHKDGDSLPGTGFFELARELGHDISDKEKFWIREVEKVYAAWAK